jgi:hypothetical protein
MGWAWRSSESYGDKDEPAEKPETDSPGAKEPEASGSEKKKSWWDQFHDNSTEDDYSSDWRGYQGPASDAERYSYGGAIDDSDSQWYRKSSFKYSKYKDYSPSSLFRSAFYSPRLSYGGLSSGENEAKNKAIRALRTLSRNANTICDKNAKISYAVQYSTGVDANTFSENLIDGKAVKTIYVSPDSVVNAETTEDEDAAVDALTGFVLLRVQIAQDFNARVINEVNATALRSLPTKLLNVIKDENATAGPLAATYVDECLSGMLSKGLLTRLARRHVVKDWGGFAPYFVRHAKKFTGVREKLEATELSVEGLVGKLTYNLVDDENPFDLGEEVERIVAEHLGEEVAPENILMTCFTLVLKLRDYVRRKLAETAESRTEAGPIENELRDMLEEFIEQHGKSAAAKKAESDAAKNMLTALAELMGEQFLHQQQQRESTAPVDVHSSYPQIQNELVALSHMEQLLNALKDMDKTLKSHAELLHNAKDNPSDLAFHAARASYEQTNIVAKFTHFNIARNEFKRRGAENNFDPQKYCTADTAKVTEKIAEETAALEKLIEEYQQTLKDSMGALKEQIAGLAKTQAEKMAAAKSAAEEFVKTATEAGHEIQKMHEESGKISSLGQIVRETNNLVARIKNRYEDTAEHINRGIELIENCRTIKTLKTQHDKLLSNADLSFTADLRSDWQYNCSTTAMSHFAQTGVAALDNLNYEAREKGNLDDLPKQVRESRWHESAIRKFLSQLNSPDAGFEAQALAQTYAEAFEQLEKICENNGGKSVPRNFDDIENEDLKKKLETLANSLGFSDEQSMLDVFNDAEELPESTMAEAGKEIGQKICKILPLFDELNSTDNELFGEVVGVKTNVLADSTKQVNDEARNDPEEDYVAYLSHSEAKPVVHISRPKINVYAKREADASKKRMRNVITRIHEALQFHNTKRTGDIYGASSGDLDEGGLHKLSYDCEHIWTQKTIAQIPDVAVGILVDQSGSMSGGKKIFEAREMCIALAEAIKKIPGIHLHIYGHTANTKNMSDLTLFEHYSSMSDTGVAAANLGSLGGIDAISNNYDGYAIKETAKLLSRDPAKRKYLFVIADGLPHGEGYCGPEAEKHVTSVCKFVRERLKIATYAFAVGVTGSHQAKFVSQYGRDNVMFLTNVTACLPQITRFLRNTIQKEKTLVEIGS